jgi:DNA-binding NtrC family response regulator
MPTNQHGSILIVDDNITILNALKLLLKYHFAEVFAIRSPNLLPSTLREHRFDIIILDMNFRAGINNGNEGLYWLAEIKRVAPQSKVLLITGFGDIDLAVRGMREGAADFMLKPWDNNQLIKRINELLNTDSKQNNILLRTKSSNSTDPLSRIIGNSDSLDILKTTISKVANTDANVLILGENGVGKELVAQALHSLSERGRYPIHHIDLASLSETLFESELFGNEEGAFTDAKKTRKGKLLEANKSTIFFDEIANLALAQQSKLLTVLQRREVIPIGSAEPIPLDVRIISATNKPLAEMVENGTFREDLHYRLNTIQIVVPPLRQRLNDIPELVSYFIAEFAERYHKQQLSILPKAMDKLTTHRWPGNIRELRHVIEKASIMCENQIIKPTDFQFNNITNLVNEADSLNLAEVERHTILKALIKHKGNLSNAAKELGITRTTLYNKIEKYQIIF